MADDLLQPIKALSSAEKFWEAPLPKISLEFN